jgi:hypothetical protein
MSDRVLTQQTRLLRSLSPPIKAFGIGGSVGAGQADKLADLDFFIVLPTRHFFRHLLKIRSLLPGSPTVAALPEPEFHSGFGFKVSYILRDGTGVEYFFNCLETLSDGPMRLKTKILFDPLGLFRKSVKKGTIKRQSQVRPFLRLLAYEYLSEVFKIRKRAIRGEVVSLFARLERLRRVLISLDRLAVLGQVCSPHDADRNLEADFGEAYVRGLLETLGGSSANSILASIQVMRRRIVTRMRRLRKGYRSIYGSAYFSLERNAFREIGMALRKHAKPRIN